MFAGFLLGLIPVIYIFYSTQLSPTLMVMVLYFVVLYASFVLVVMLNLAKAMANKLPLF
jgi:hypothetical protein